MGKPDLNWVAFSDDQLLQALMRNGFSEQIVIVYMMAVGEVLRTGSFMEDYNKIKSLYISEATLLDFSKSFAIGYYSDN